MAKSIQAEADRLVLLANIGERIVEAVKESGLLRTKRRAARTTKPKQRAAKKESSVSPRVAKELSAGTGSPVSSRVPQPRTTRDSNTGTKGAVVEE